MASAGDVWRRIAARLGGGPFDESVNVLGRELRLRVGGFRRTPDYDDAWFLACAMRAKVIFDVGANVGYDALLALAFSKVECVALVEANPEALAVATHNVSVNGLTERARFIPGFASDTADERITFWTTGSGAAGSAFATHAHTAAARGDTMQVATTTLDSIALALGMQPDFIKIDVEGAEAKVLAGSRQIAARRGARFLVEMHSNPDLSMRANAKAVLQWCEQVGHSAWYLKEGARVTDAEQIEHRGRCHLLLQPNDRPFPVWLSSIEQGAPLRAAVPPNAEPDR